MSSNKKKNMALGVMGAVVVATTLTTRSALPFFS